MTLFKSTSKSTELHFICVSWRFEVEFRSQIQMTTWGNFSQIQTRLQNAKSLCKRSHN